MNARVELNRFRANIKELICGVLTDIYKSQHNGLLPNWDNDEEIIVDESCLTTQYIVIQITSQSGTSYEKEYINEYIVTLDYDLYFRIGDNNDETHWNEINTDDLVTILTMLKNNQSKICK